MTDDDNKNLGPDDVRSADAVHRAPAVPRTGRVAKVQGRAISGPDIIKNPPTPLDLFRRVRVPGIEKRRSASGDVVKICCVSTPLTIENFGPGASPDLRLTADGAHRVTTFTGDREIWREDRIAEIEAALQHCPDIIAFGELIFPPIGPNEQRNEDERFLDVLRHRLEKYDSSAFVFCGSHHTREKQNVGVIIPFGQHDFEDERGRKAGHIKYIKRQSTLSIGERAAAAPDDFRPPAVLRPEGYVTVLMSAEVFDLEHTRKMSLRNVYQTGGFTGMDLVVVPSFAADANEPVAAMCQYLSRWTATTVVHVNANKGAGFPQTSLYVCGTHVKRDTHPEIVKRHDEIEVPLHNGDHSILHVFTIDRDLVDADRREWLLRPEMRRLMVPVSISGARLRAGGRQA